MDEKYGYVRVSTREQKEDRQQSALRGQGIPEKNIYTDKQSGRNFEQNGLHDIRAILFLPA